MANRDNPHGLRPLMRGMTAGNVPMRSYMRSSAYAYAIFKWDQLTRAAGYVKGPANGITPGTTLLIGVAVSYAAASTEARVQVIDDPYAIFDVQEDNSGAANVVQAKMGYNANLTAGAGGTPTADNSITELSGTSINTTASLDVTILDLVQDPENAFGAWAQLEVIINKHLLKAATMQTQT